MKQRTLRDGDTGEQLVQLLVVAHRQLEMARVDTRLLVVARGVASQLEHLSGEVLHDGRQVDGRTSANTLSVVAPAEHAVDTTDL